MRRVAVALSGGVDSSVAAALLREQGHEVVGFTLKVWDSSRCCSLDDAEDARRVARHLGIPFYVLDVRAEFEREVIGPFVDAYARGLTPSPCVWCNRRIKFRWLLARARALGCEVLATGHYARLDGEPGARRLRRGLDPTKDQSYFLVPDAPGDLDRLWFPLGALAKAEVRAEAARRGLPVAAKAESQDVCFVPDGDLEAFLRPRLPAPAAPGEVVDGQGRVLGRHRGVHAYTVGQRRGLGVAAAEPLYVLRVEAGANRLVLAPRAALFAREFALRDPVWLAPVPPALECSVKIRSTAPAVACRVEGAGGQTRVTCAEPQFAVAPGQFAALYAGDQVLGGGWIGAGDG
ncbi:MAG: tRNA 2-thiouridine(34) synthase MnmA [Deferrisomatales bacterium]